MNRRNTLIKTGCHRGHRLVTCWWYLQFSHFHGWFLTISVAWSFAVHALYSLCHDQVAICLSVCPMQSGSSIVSKQLKSFRVVLLNVLQWQLIADVSLTVYLYLWRFFLKFEITASPTLNHTGIWRNLPLYWQNDLIFTPHCLRAV